MRQSKRTTISIPPDLKARMDAVDEPVNWSAIACQAFEAKLAEITKRRGAMDMKEVAMRLRVSKRKNEAVQYQEGFEVGRRWAMNQAEADELERLADLHLHAQTIREWQTLFYEYRNDASSAAERLAKVILGEDGEPGRAEAREFWENVLGKREAAVPSEFVRGFAEGALEVWDEVQGEL
jgi:hypothetical protein